MHRSTHSLHFISHPDSVQAVWTWAISQGKKGTMYLSQVWRGDIAQHSSCFSSTAYISFLLRSLTSFGSTSESSPINLISRGITVITFNIIWNGSILGTWRFGILILLAISFYRLMQGLPSYWIKTCSLNTTFMHIVLLLSLSWMASVTDDSEPITQGLLTALAAIWQSSTIPYCSGLWYLSRWLRIRVRTLGKMAARTICKPWVIGSPTAFRSSAGISHIPATFPLSHWWLGPAQRLQVA